MNLLCYMTRSWSGSFNFEIERTKERRTSMWFVSGSMVIRFANRLGCFHEPRKKIDILSKDSEGSERTNACYSLFTLFICHHHLVFPFSSVHGHWLLSATHQWKSVPLSVMFSLYPVTSAIWRLMDEILETVIEEINHRVCDKSNKW